MSLFSKPIMAQFSRFHMREQDAAKLVKEKEDKKQRNAQHVKEKGVSFRCIKWDQECISKFKKIVMPVKEKARLLQKMENAKPALEER